MSTVSATSSTPNVFEILSYGGDITFIGGGTTEKMIVIGPTSFNPQDERIIISDDAFSVYFKTGIGDNKMFAPVDVPDGATLTELKCFFFDTALNAKMICTLQRNLLPATPEVIGSVESTGSSGAQSHSTPLSHLVDRDSSHYYIMASHDGSGCAGPSCAIQSVKITYTVPSGMVVGGEFYPVDNVSLILAYGLVNSWWIAPIGIGIGVEVYLVKRKIK